jgi:prepilin-type processing-associated H-X9-DG protein
MDENLVGYLLNALDADEHRAVEAHLEASPAARERLDALRHALEPLAADRADIEPPPDLARRTLARLAGDPCDLPRAPTVSRGRAAGHGGAFWRRADVLVAACLLLTVLGLGIPWVASLVRRPDGLAQRIACAENLQQFYVGLKTYSDLHGRKFPDVANADAPPRNVAGMVVPILRDAGALPAGVSVRCPANGDCLPCAWTLADLRKMPPEQFRLHAPSLASCYAYSLGHRAGDGLVGLGFDADKPNHRLPIMADCPPVDPTQGNSPNHGGTGQNVLYVDGHVEWCPTRTVGLDGDDIYLNRQRRVAPGVDWTDSVLGRSEASPLP